MCVCSLVAVIIDRYLLEVKSLNTRERDITLKNIEYYISRIRSIYSSICKFDNGFDNYIDKIMKARHGINELVTIESKMYSYTDEELIDSFKLVEALYKFVSVVYDNMLEKQN